MNDCRKFAKIVAKDLYSQVSQNKYIVGTYKSIKKHLEFIIDTHEKESNTYFIVTLIDTLSGGKLHTITTNGNTLEELEDEISEGLFDVL